MNISFTKNFGILNVNALNKAAMNKWFDIELPGYFHHDTTGFVNYYTEYFAQNPMTNDEVQELLGTRQMDVKIEGEHALLKITLEDEATAIIAFTPKRGENQGHVVEKNLEECYISIKIWEKHFRLIEIMRDICIKHIESRKDEPSIAALINQYAA